MSRTDIESTVQAILQDVLDNPSLELQPSLSAEDVDGWDSLAHINIITAVEKAFGIRFALGEIDSLRHVGDMLALIREKTA